MFLSFFTRLIDETFVSHNRYGTYLPYKPHAVTSFFLECFNNRPPIVKCRPIALRYPDFNAFSVVCIALHILSFPNSLAPYRTLLVEGLSCMRAKKRFAWSVSFEVLLPVCSSFTLSHSLVRSITVFDSHNPDSLVSIIL